MGNVACKTDDCYMAEYYYKKVLLIFLGVVLLFVLGSCQKQERENNIAKQEAQIDTYVESQTKDSVVFNNGVYRIIKRFGNGAELEKGDSVYFYYAIYKFSSGKGELYVTNQDSVAKANNFCVTSEPKSAVLNRKNFIPGLFYGMDGMQQGEYSNLVFSSRNGYGNDVVYNIGKNVPLLVEVWIEKIVKN